MNIKKLKKKLLKEHINNDMLEFVGDAYLIGYMEKFLNINYKHHVTALSSLPMLILLRYQGVSEDKIMYHFNEIIHNRSKYVNIDGTTNKESVDELFNYINS